jgi:hypothetical protein
MIGTVAVIGALAGLWAGIRGITLLARGLAHADEDSASLDVIRGIRGVAVALGTAALAGGVLLEQTWLLAFGVVFLLEELYETGVVALVLRAAQKAEPLTPAFREPGAPPPSSPLEGRPSFELRRRAARARSGVRRAASTTSRGPSRAPAAAGSQTTC